MKIKNKVLLCVLVVLSFSWIKANIVQAKVDSYVIKDTDTGVMYEYLLKDIKDASEDYADKDKEYFFQEFLEKVNKYGIYAIHDDIKKYILNEDIMEYFLQCKRENRKFDMNEYINSEICVEAKEIMNTSRVTFDKIITFDDINFENKVRKQINKPNGDIYKNDIRNIKELDLRNSNISNITGIEGFINLQNIDVSKNSIKDLSPLKDLNYLKKLDLSSNEIEDISVLSNFKNLTELFLRDNNIKDYSPSSFLYNEEAADNEDQPVVYIKVKDENQQRTYDRAILKDFGLKKIDGKIFEEKLNFLDYYVNPGDTLYSISRAYMDKRYTSYLSRVDGVYIICKINHISTFLSIGQHIIIPVSKENKAV